MYRDPVDPLSQPGTKGQNTSPGMEPLLWLRSPPDRAQGGLKMHSFVLKNEELIRLDMDVRYFNLLFNAFLPPGR